MVVVNLFHGSCGQRCGCRPRADLLYAGIQRSLGPPAQRKKFPSGKPANLHQSVVQWVTLHFPCCPNVSVRRRELRPAIVTKLRHSRTTTLHLQSCFHFRLHSLHLANTSKTTYFLSSVTDLLANYFHITRRGPTLLHNKNVWSLGVPRLERFSSQGFYRQPRGRGC